DAEMVVSPVATVHGDEVLGPDAMRQQELDAAVRRREAARVLLVGRGDARSAVGIVVERDHASTEDVAIARQVLRVGLDPIAGPGEQRPGDEILRDVAPRDAPTQAYGRVSELLHVIEVAGGRLAAPYGRTELDDVAGLEEQAERPQDFGAISVERHPPPSA